MSEPTEKEQVDMAIILEGRIKERVKEILEPMVERTVVNIIGKELARQWAEQKQNMMTEICITVGKVIGEAARNEDRRPLWESTPEELGLPLEMLNNHMMGKKDEE